MPTIETESLTIRGLYTPAEQRRNRRILHELFTVSPVRPIRIYAQTDVDPEDDNHFWYKVFFFTACGVFTSDTGFEYVMQRRDAEAIIRSQGLQEVTRAALMANWHRYGCWPSRRIGQALLEQWQAVYA